MKNMLFLRLLLPFMMIFMLPNTSKSQNKASQQLNAADYEGKLDQLLSLEIAAEITGFDSKKAQIVHENNAHKAFGGEVKPPRECRYNWENGRTKGIKIGDKVVEGPHLDFVEITRVSNTTIERFQRNYPSLTPAQKKAAEEQLMNTSKSNPQRNTASDALDTTASDLVKNHEAEQIKGAGEAAVWFPRSNELRVFFKGLSFSVKVDVSYDDQVNKSKAIKLSNRIIDTNFK